MALTNGEPGEYLDDINGLPSSVVSVETSIPCFFGFTEKASEYVERDLMGKARKIQSLVDYEYYFGGPDKANATAYVKLDENNEPMDVKLVCDRHSNNMYYAIKIFFDNGGGPCYIHSLGNYDRQDISGAQVGVDTYKGELNKIDLQDEVTLIVFPDLAAIGNSDQYYEVYNAALQKASDLGNMFVILDVYPELDGQFPDPVKSVNSLRAKISDTTKIIKYGAAYFPYLETVYNSEFDSANIKLTFDPVVTNTNMSANLLNNFNYKDAKGLFDLFSVLSFFDEDHFRKIHVASYTSKANEILAKVNSIKPYFNPAEQEALEINANKLSKALITQGEAAVTEKLEEYDFNDMGREKDILTRQVQEKIMAMYNELPRGIKVDLEAQKSVNATSIEALIDTFFSRIVFFNSEFEVTLRKSFSELPLLLPASPAIAGVFARVDRNRGVWKAPANVSLNAVMKPELLINDIEQDDFNVDVETGKSINCIRFFSGRGTLVWGARTLAGNDNEWRYVSVRRFANMVERSCQNALKQFVFSINDDSTWVLVRRMLDTYLTNLWRQGALQGAKPEHAFYTAVGLNKTMTADDVLNGLMIVEIGLAVVKPAEFIILRISQKTGRP